MKPSKFLGLLCLQYTLSLSWGTSMFEMNLKDLSVHAQKVVQAKVTAVVPKWDSENEMLYTYIRMNIVDDVIGDDEDNEIIVKMLGGTDGRVSLDVKGNALYTVGEESILFLFPDPENFSINQTLGMYQGKYRIFTDAQNQFRVAQEPNKDGVPLLKRAGADTGDQGNNLPLGEFKQTILKHRAEAGK